MGPLDLEMIEEAHHVVHHLPAVHLAIVRFAAPAVPTAIDHDDLVIFCQRFRNAGHFPLKKWIHGKAVDENDWLPLALDGVVNLDPVGIEIAVRRENSGSANQEERATGGGKPKRASHEGGPYC